MEGGVYAKCFEPNGFPHQIQRPVEVDKHFFLNGPLTVLNKLLRKGILLTDASHWNQKKDCNRRFFEQCGNVYE